MASTLKNRADFNKLWFGQTVSTFGDKVSRIALPTIAVLDLGGGAVEVGILAALGSLPFLLLSSFVGVWVDRLPKRSVLIAADAGRMLALALIPMAYALDFLSLGLLYAVAGIVAVLTVFFELSYQSYLPSLVGMEGIPEGNQKLSISRSGSSTLGSAIGGITMQLLGNALAVVMDVISFAASLVGLVLIKHREEPAHKSGHVRRGVRAELVEGLRAVNSDRRLRNLILAVTLVNLGSGVAAALLIVYAYQTAALTPGQVGVTFAVGAVGLIVGGLIARKLAKWVTLSGTLALCVALNGLAILLVPLSGVAAAFVAMAASQFLIGIAHAAFGINVMSLVQTITPRHVLGRVNGIALTAIWGCATFGGVIAAMLGTAIGPRDGLVIAGALALSGVVLILFGPVRTVRQLPSMPMPPKPAPEAAGEAAEAVSEAETPAAESTQKVGR